MIIGKGDKGMARLIGKEISAIVLRFRDKGENVEDTIQEHKEYLKSGESYVWWGWWAKGYEHPPFDYFKCIDQKIKNRDSEFKVFLLHTKTKKLYVGRCTDIRYSDSPKDGDGAIPSPDPDNTPQYYNKVIAKLWLKFTSIDEVESTSLLDGKYSFMSDSEQFFRRPIKENHLIASFASCKVARIEEFKVQERTIWFLRNQKSSDGNTNIDEWLPLPDNFAKHHTHAQHGAYKLLVLSDLHFSKTQGKHNFEIEKINKQKLSLIDSLCSVIEKASIGGYDKIAGVIIAGDFVFRPNVEEFELAKNFVYQLLERLRLKPEQLAMVPGNHDISFLGPKKRNIDEMPPEATAEATKNYRDFYESIFNSTANKYLCCSRKIKLPNDLQLEIICANSSVLQQEEEYFVQGYVGERQWDEIRTQTNMQPDVQTYAYRILLMHHHLLGTSIFSEKPHRKKNYNILLDAGRVSHNIRKYNIRLVIHGHGHESGYDRSAPLKKRDLEKAPNPYDIISVGSAGSGDLPPGEFNSFGILDFSIFGKVKYEKYLLPTTDRERDKSEGKPDEVWDIPIIE